MIFTNLGEKLLKGIKANYPIGGLEIGDAALRWSLFKDGKWNFSTINIPPGIFLAGEIKNTEEFIGALITLKKEIGLGRKFKIPAIISLNSPRIYTQTISIPILDEDKLEKALDLNLRMSSPMPFEQVYSGTELIKRDEDAGKMEYLVSFIEKDKVDDVLSALKTAGFLPVAIEPKSVSIARLMRKTSYFDFNKSYIVMSVDSGGMEFLIIKNGGLHFDYFNSWADLEQVDKQISLEGFRSIIVRGINQVVNFYKSQWKEPVDSIFLVSSNLNEEIKKIVESNFSFKLQELKLDIGEGVSNELAVVLGAGLRGTTPRSEDNEISLMGWDAKEEYRREQIIRFLGLWRVLVPSILGILLVAFMGTLFFLDKSEADLFGQPALNLAPEQIKEIDELEKRVKSFNSKVAMISNLEKSYGIRMVDILKELKPMLDQNEIGLNRLTTSLDGVINLTGEAKTYESVISFRKAMEENANLTGVNLPFTNIQQSPQGFAFSTSFSFKPSNME